jgi:CHAT domain-containing protein
MSQLFRYQRWSILVAFFLFICASAQLASAPTQAQTISEPVTLGVGNPVEGKIHGGERHNYQLTLEAKQYLQLEVVQMGVDVSITLFDPANKKVAESALPHGPNGPETITTVVAAAGTYRLEVRTARPDAPLGRYRARVVQLHTAAQMDADTTAAERLFGEALTLSMQGTNESIRGAIAKFEAMIPLVDYREDQQDLAAVLNNIGQNHNLLGEWQQALDYYQRSLKDLRAVPDDGSTIRKTVEGIALGGIACMYHRLGDAGQSLRYNQEALALLQRGGYQRSAALTMGNIGTLYLELGELQLALNYYQRAIETLKQQNAPGAEALILAGLGTTHLRMGNAAQAVQLYEQALANLQAVNIARDQPHFLYLLGQAYHDSGDRGKAFEFLNSALAGARAAGDRAVEGSVLDILGVLYGAQGETKKAFDTFASALVLQRAIEHKTGEARTLYHQAQLARDNGQLNDARASIVAALAIVEEWRAKINVSYLRASYLATAEDYYELATDILLRLHKADPTHGYDAEAFQVSERERARTLIETLTEAPYELRIGGDQKLLQQEQILQQKISATAWRLQRLNINQSVTAAQLQKDLQTLRADYQRLQAEIIASNPHYAAMTYPQPLDVKEIQAQVLDEDSLLLEYSLGEKQSLLAAVTRDHFEVFTLPGRADIEAAARRFHGLLTARNTRIKFETVAEKNDRIAQADEEWPEAANVLSKMLLGPVANRLGRKRLLIVADGALQYIPFSALTVPKSRESGVVSLESRRSETDSGLRTPDSRLPDLLVSEHEIVSLPSASTLAVLRRELAGRQPAPKAIAVLADPVFRTDDNRFRQAHRQTTAGAVVTLRSHTRGVEENVADQLTRAVQDVGAGQEIEMARLPYTRNEAQSIMALTPPSQRQVALDFAATRIAAVDAGLREYRIIHMATHGLLNSTHPELSGLVFSLIDEKGQPVNGFLRSHEIFNLRLRADLVVLSGCRTGLGQEIRGEGLVGLTRGFMYAGAARVLVSLWDIHDEATAELMKRFYAELLGKKLSPAAALAAAQSSMAHDARWSSPYYWAGFTLQGEPR